jgi:DNA-binding NarL/FixJ family response regulator
METNPSFAEKIADAQKRLDGAVVSQRRRDGAFDQFTQEEKEVALLLTDGLSQKEIVRRLNTPAVEVARIVGSIREKVSGKASSDPVIDAIAKEYGLTTREADVLNCLQQGKNTAAIASELFVIPDTVRVHVRNLLKKLSMENRQEIPAWLEKYKAAGRK